MSHVGSINVPLLQIPASMLVKRGTAGETFVTERVKLKQKF